ncbi:MAG: alpha/beta hydrolase [Polyangiaceae bacterium]|nr:alpha/beta hydrolase [Polyangiaceae bacterium]
MKFPWWTKVLLGVAGLYGAVCSVGCFAARAIVFPAPRDDLPALAEGGRVVYILSEGLQIPAIYFAAKPGNPTLLHFHGNGETLNTESDLALAYHRRGLGMFVMEYRGYGASPGSASEPDLYKDAEAAIAKLGELGVEDKNIVLSGMSIGTGIAAEMASRGHGGKLVLVAPYTSLEALADKLAPILPTSILIQDKFDSLSKAGKIAVPTLVIHGTDDELIPFEMGKTLASAITGAELVAVKGGHHNDLFLVKPDLLNVIAAHALGEQNSAPTHR